VGRYFHQGEVVMFRVSSKVYVHSFIKITSHAPAKAKLDPKHAIIFMLIFSSGSQPMAKRAKHKHISKTTVVILLPFPYGSFSMYPTQFQPSKCLVASRPPPAPEKRLSSFILAMSWFRARRRWLRKSTNTKEYNQGEKWIIYSHLVLLSPSFLF